jgi:hypothetical protein
MRAGGSVMKRIVSLSVLAFFLGVSGATADPLLTQRCAAIAAGAAEVTSNTSKAPAAAATISILELHRQVDTRSLPELIIENPV